MISHAKLTAMKSNTNKVYAFGKGGGHREKSNSSDAATFDKNYPIPSKFQQQSVKKTDNNCVWLSTACLMTQINEDDAHEMIWYFNKDQTKFEWMYIRDPKDEDEKNLMIKNGKESLTKKLQRDIGYDIKPPPKDYNKHCYLEQLLYHTDEGYYLCNLEFDNGSDTHYVGIDCNLGLIFDCVEEYALKFTIENLNYCSGQDDTKIHKIPYCYKLKDNKKKRKYKYMK